MTSQSWLRKGIGGACTWGVAAVAGVLLVGPGPARADHSLNKGCIVCHSLRSTSVVPGTRNILQDEIAANLYQSYWYCGIGGKFSGATDRLDCSYCHDKPTGDPAADIAKFSSSMTTSTWPASGSAHPVDVEAATVSFKAATQGPMKRITCNDCHGSDVSPADPCDKSKTGGGYPNHANVPANNAGTGANRRPGHLDSTKKYLSGGPEAPVDLGPTGPDADWAGGNLTDMLCFKCHLLGGIASDIKTQYDLPGGGHNVLGVGTLALKKLPCYDCHDPHASVVDDKGIYPANRALIITGATLVKTYTNPQRTTKFMPTAAFTGATSGDRVVCMGCHGNSSVTTESVVANTLAAGNVRFPFHVAVHTEAAGTGNCLQKYNGCHQSPHNTDIFRCLDCHSGASQGTNSRLTLVRHVGDEFVALPPDAAGSIKLQAGLPPYANLIKSRHDIPYVDTEDMAYTPSKTSPRTGRPGGNGCLYCHDVPAGQSGKLLADLQSSPAYYPAKSVTSRADLGPAYDAFCLFCHNGSGSTGSTFGLFSAPDVDNYYTSSGHGRSTGNYPVTVFGTSPPAKRPANTGCLVCHVYHGSTAYKLLPGDVQTGLYSAKPAEAGRVVKGFAYTGSATVGTAFTIGGVRDSTYVDYTDYTDYNNNSRLGSSYKLQSQYASNYTQPWSSYSGNTTAPAGTVTPFGTSGDMRNNTDSSAFPLSCNDQETGNFTKKIGFCNTCHFYNDSTNGTQATAGWAYTHEGYCSTGADGKSCSTSGSKDQRSQKNFFKDCCECHDPHGSGVSGSTGDTNANLAMVRGKVFAPRADNTNPTITDTNNWKEVVFKQREGATNSYGVASSSTKPICAVCHDGPPAKEGSATNCATANTLRVDYQYLYQYSSGGSLSPAVPPTHNDVVNCTQCHTHGPAANLPGFGTNQRFVGFNRAACTGCHGLPPIASWDTATDPDNEKPENYPGGGGVHKRHVDFLRAKFTAQGKTAVLDDLCSPCHGANVGSGPGSGHPDTVADAAWDWATWNWTAATGWGTTGKWNMAVDIIDGLGNFGPLAIYEGSSTDKSVKTTINAKGGEPQRCANLNCHGPGAPYNATAPGSAGDANYYVGGAVPSSTAYPKTMRLLWDYNTSTDLWARDITCAGCHGAAPGMTILGTNHPADPATVITVGSYTSALGAQGVTANYFGTVSGFARGGHGDAAIQNETPGPKTIPMLDSAPGFVTPMHCKDCHDEGTRNADGTPTVAHFPTATTNLVTRYRLKSGTVLESGPPGTSGLCNTCHPRSLYPGTATSAGPFDKKHHPSYYYYSDAATLKDVIPKAGTKVLSTPPTGYSASSATWQTDFFSNFWGGSDQVGAPAAVLPLEQYVAGSGSPVNKVLCVTCHNPHGTDLHAGSTFVNDRSIPDNNMLRLRDEDNTLCEGCH